MTSPQQRCGTCRWWDMTTGKHCFGVCVWPEPELPDSITERGFVRAMAPDEGQTCPTWALRQEEQSND